MYNHAANIMIIDELNILPCHSIWKPSLDKNDHMLFGLDQKEWVLVSFQIDGNDHLAMVEQILKCLMTTKKNTLTVFSGGFTKQEFPEISESKSYYELMIRFYNVLSDQAAINELKMKINDTKFSSLIKTFDGFSELKQNQIFIENVTIEEFAMDSFDNLYFSLALFKLKHDTKMLKNVIITGFEFKEKRFRDLHWKYVGAKNKLTDCTLEFNSNIPIHHDLEKHDVYIQSVNDSERLYGYEKFVNDPFAVRSKLFEKKKLRNFKALSAKDSDYGKYLIDIDPMLSDQDILIEIEQSELYV